MKDKLGITITRKDLVLDWFSGTGAGGQHRNKHRNCLRLYHPASGVRVTSQGHRDRASNRREAMERMIADPKFRAWCSVRLTEIEQGQSMEERVERSMAEGNILLEVKEKGRWVEADPFTFSPTYEGGDDGKTDM